MMRRLQVGEPVLNINRFEDEYKNHLKLKKLVQKVGNHGGKLYKEKDLPPINNSKVNSVFL